MGEGGNVPPTSPLPGICCPPEGCPSPAKGAAAKVPKLPAAASGPLSSGWEREASQGRPASGLGAGSPSPSPGDGTPGSAHRARRSYLRPWRDQLGCTPPAPGASRRRRRARLRFRGRLGFPGAGSAAG